jgi:hypothetical protein
MPFLSLVKALGFRAKFFLIAALAALAVAMSVAQVVMERVAMIQATRAQTEALAGVNLAQQYLQALQAHKSLLVSAEGADASAGLPAARERIESTHAALLSWHVAEHRGGVLEDAWRSVEEQAGAMAGALPEHFSGRKAAQALHGHGMHSDTVLAYLAAISDRYGLVPDRDIDTHHLAHMLVVAGPSLGEQLSRAGFLVERSVREGFLSDRDRSAIVGSVSIAGDLARQLSRELARLPDSLADGNLKGGQRRAFGFFRTGADRRVRADPAECHLQRGRGFVRIPHAGRGTSNARDTPWRGVVGSPGVPSGLELSGAVADMHRLPRALAPGGVWIFCGVPGPDGCDQRHPRRCQSPGDR